MPNPRNPKFAAFLDAQAAAADAAPVAAAPESPAPLVRPRMTEEERRARIIERRGILPAWVDQERDRRIDTSFIFNGVKFQSRPSDRENIAGATTLAIAAMATGAQPGDLRWHGGDADFAWIAEDNSLVTMDAVTMIAFGQTAAKWKSDHIFAARALKDMTPIPTDYTADAYWP